MNSRLFFIMLLLGITIKQLYAQVPPAMLYHSSRVETSDLYQNGNSYQKDFLLFMDMLTSTHPAFATSNTSPFNTDSLLKTDYEKLKSCPSEEQLRLYLTTVAALLRDGHTYVQFKLDRNGLFYLFQIAIDFPDVYLATIPNEYSSELGQKITAINHAPIWDVISAFKGCMSSDNDIYWHTKAGQYMQWFTLWEETPFMQQDSSLILSLSNGKDIVINPQHLPEKMDGLAVWKPEKQVFNAITRPKKTAFSYQLIEDPSICYFQFNQCIDNSTLRYQYYVSGDKTPEKELDKKLSSYPRFDTLVAKMFAAIKEKQIETLVIDVRNNGGGNSALCDILLSYLISSKQIKQDETYIRVSQFWKEHHPEMYADAEQAMREKKKTLEEGKLYNATDISARKSNRPFTRKMAQWFRYNRKEEHIFEGNIIFIQGKNTYSSAGLLITKAIDNKIGTVIGEKSAYKPCHYGDILTWELPNTKIQGGISHKIFNRPDADKCTERHITPDVLIELHLDREIPAGKDLYWDWIIEKYGK